MGVIAAEAAVAAKMGAAQRIRARRLVFARMVRLQGRIVPAQESAICMAARANENR